MRISTLGLLTHPTRPVGDLPRICAEICKREGIRLYAEKTAGLSEEYTLSTQELAQRSDALLVLGGDGTILHAVARLGNIQRPVLGINTGTLGFLTVGGAERLDEAIVALSHGKYCIENKMRLIARFQGEETLYTALNDLALTRGGYPRVMRAQARVDGAVAMNFNGDGLVVATPTGSTAYSLAAGGPIVAPGMDCFLLTPVSPHTLSVRPTVVSASSMLEVEVFPRGEDGGIVLEVDGLCRRTLEKPATLQIWRSPEPVSLIRLGDQQFFERLRGKLIGS